jgi:hypothetical protein
MRKSGGFQSDLKFFWRAGVYRYRLVLFLSNIELKFVNSLWGLGTEKE